MSEQDKGDRNPELSDFPQLREGRELFIHLLHDDSPFVNLGYTTKQMEVARETLFVETRI